MVMATDLTTSNHEMQDITYTTRCVEHVAFRRGVLRPTKIYYLLDGDHEVAECHVVVDDEYPGMLAWLSVSGAYQRRGIAERLMRDVANAIGRPIALDVFGDVLADPIYDRVRPAPCRIWERMSRSPDWRVWWREIDGMPCAEPVQIQRRE
jgi:GNAT superfamily N-acetyltransferase